jgi:hypothetical protein
MTPREARQAWELGAITNHEFLCSTLAWLEEVIEALAALEYALRPPAEDWGTPPVHTHELGDKEP